MNIESIFASPPDEFRPYPFWFWNGRMTAEEITWQLEQCRSQKIMAVLIHPRYALVTPYLGEEYLAMVDHTCREAKRLGMKVWLYDEYNWPSGTVAGRIIRDFPEYRMRFLRYAYRQVDGPAKLDRPEDLGDGQFLCVQAWDAERDRILTFDHDSPDLPDGRWAVAWFCLNEPDIYLSCVEGHADATGLPGYVDLLKPEAVARFMELTHEVYYERLKEYFGDVIIGIFTDEVGVVYDFDYGYDFARSITTSLPWTPELQQDFGVEKLIHLVADGPQAEATRRDYWQRVADLYRRSYHEPIGRWCEEHGIAYTGHVVCEEFATHYQADLYSALRHMHVPGTDWCSRQADLDVPVFRTVKVAAGIADLHHRRHVVCENFAATGWGLTLADMKRITDYLYVMGTNLTCIHGFYYTLRGGRVHECPPSEFFQSPWWRYMHRYSDYTARLGAMLSAGRRVCEVGLIVPTRALWAANNRTQFEPESFFQRHQRAFDALTRRLVEIGLDCEYVFDTAIEDGMIGSDGLAWGDLRLATLILPQIDAIDPALWKRLEAFVKSGGTVVTVGQLPTVEGIDSAVVADVLGQPIGDHETVLKEVFDHTRVKMLDDDRIAFARRTLNDGRVLCFAFEIAGRSREDCTIVFSGRYGVQRIDLDSGQFHEVHHQTTDGETHLVASFDAFGSAMFVLTPVSGASSHRPAKPAPARRISLPDRWQLALEQENVLKICHPTVMPLPDGRHFDVHIRVHCDGPIERARLLLEGDCYPRVRVNTVDLADRIAPCRVFDSDQFAVDITSQLRPGENRLWLQWRPTAEDRVIPGLTAHAGVCAILPHVYLVGRFMVDAQDHLTPMAQETPVRLGSWRTQGLPYFAGTATYCTTVDLSADDLARRVALVADVAGQCAEVLVNGTPCGVRVWPPYRFDVGRALVAGANRIEIRVTNTAFNLLTPLPGETDLDNPHAGLAFMHRSGPESGLFAAHLERY